MLIDKKEDSEGPEYGGPLIFIRKDRGEHHFTQAEAKEFLKVLIPVSVIGLILFWISIQITIQNLPTP